MYRGLGMMVIAVAVLAGGCKHLDTKKCSTKDKAAKLKAYLQEQKTMLEERLKKSNEVIEQTAGYDNEQLLASLEKIPADKLRTKALKPLSDMAQNIHMNLNTKRNIELLEQSLVDINSQLEKL